MKIDKMGVLRLIIWGFLFSASFPGMLFSAEKESGDVKIIGQTFKAFARAYVATADVKTLKEKGIARIDKMKETRFNKKYAEVYSVVKTLPARIRSKYGMTEMMSKPGAIQIVRSLDKKMLYEMIDNIPDAVIAREFYERTAQSEQGVKGGDLFSSISRAWGALVMKMNKSADSGK